MHESMVDEQILIILLYSWARIRRQDIFFARHLAVKRLWNRVPEGVWQVTQVQVSIPPPVYAGLLTRSS